MNQTDILLESGTNEMELMEFYVGGQSFGVNVAKIRSVLQYEPDKLSETPNMSSSQIGVYLFHERFVPVIDLRKELKTPIDPNNDGNILLVTEFNNFVSGYLVDNVHRIHRVSWKAITPLSTVISDQNAPLTSTVEIEGNDILMLDLEAIIASVFGIGDYEQLDLVVDDGKHERGHFTVMVADDSSIVLKALVHILSTGGYTNLIQCTDGASALETVKKLNQKSIDEDRPIKEYLDLIITDIEMPGMDGLSFCKAVKQTMGLSNLPVIMFSSMITDQMKEKCQSVGANEAITKPQFKHLVELLDEYLLSKSAMKSAA